MYATASSMKQTHLSRPRVTSHISVPGRQHTKAKELIVKIHSEINVNRETKINNKLTNLQHGQTIP